MVKHPASFRDPAGFVYHHDGVLYRQVNYCYAETYAYFISSGLYTDLVGNNLLIPHTEIATPTITDSTCYKTLMPEEIPFISYAYEWSFDELKDAALLTLELAEKAIDYGMMLKDATTYNVQFYKNGFIFLDTLSFEKVDFGTPWIAYRQFCEQFLAPLALMHFLKMPCHQLLYAYPEGIPLAVASKLLPIKSRFQLSTYLHLHLHANYAASKKKASQKTVFSEKGFRNILKSLKQTVSNFTFQSNSVWSDYYDEAAQRQNYLTEKKKLINDWISDLPAVKCAVDLGANEGLFSKIIAVKGIRTIAADSDVNAINRLYLQCKNEEIKNIIPILIDVTNPSGAIGFNNTEHQSFITRAKSDLVLALALIHHLAIGRNISFDQMATFFARFGTILLIEFVPKEDAKVAEMLGSKKDTYDWYTQQNFEHSFQKKYALLKKLPITSSTRTLYLMQQHAIS